MQIRSMRRKLKYECLNITIKHYTRKKEQRMHEVPDTFAHIQITQQIYLSEGFLRGATKFNRPK